MNFLLTFLILISLNHFNNLHSLDLNLFSDLSFNSKKEAQAEQNVYQELQERQIEFEDILSIFRENSSRPDLLQEISTKSIGSSKLSLFKNSFLNFEYANLIAYQSVKYKNVYNPIVVKFAFLKDRWYFVGFESRLKLGKFEHRMKFNDFHQKFEKEMKKIYQNSKKTIDSIDTLLRVENILSVSKSGDIKAYSLTFKEALNSKNGWLLDNIQESDKNNLGDFLKNQRNSNYSFKNATTKNHIADSNDNFAPINHQLDISVSCNQYANGFTIYLNEFSGENLTNRVNIQDNSIIEVKNVNFNKVYTSCNKFIFYNQSSENKDKIMVLKGNPKNIKDARIRYLKSDKVTILEFLEN